MDQGLHLVEAVPVVLHVGEGEMEKARKLESQR